MKQYLDSICKYFTDPFQWIWLCPLLILSGVLILDYYNLFGWDEIRQAQDEYNIKIKEIMAIIKETKDCIVLQNNMLFLLSKNADADSWLPNLTDRTMKIAQQRFEILCKV